MKSFSRKNKGKSLGCYRLPFVYCRKVNPTCHSREAGFTFVELIVVVVIIGVLSYFALSKVGDSDSRIPIQLAAACRRVVSDLRYAQQIAESEGVQTRVYFDTSNDSYSLKYENGTYLPVPVGTGNYVVQFNSGDYSEVLISGTGLSNGRLDFLPSGVALNSGASMNGQLAAVILNSVKEVTIVGSTGFIKIQDY